MKKTLFFLALMMISAISLIAQSLQTAGLNSILEKSVDKIVHKANKDTTIRKIGVYYFRNADRSISPLGIYLSEEYSTQLAMHPNSPQLVARTSIEAILDEKRSKLTAQDEFTATIKLGKLDIADAVVSGTITKIGNEYNVDVKLYNSANGNIIAADKFAINGKEYDEMYGIPGISSNNPNQMQSNTVNPINKPVQKEECEVKSICNVCFTNGLTTKEGQITVNVGGIGMNNYYEGQEHSLTISDGQTECIYDIEANLIKKWFTMKYAVYSSPNWQLKNGQFKGKPCETVPITIR